MARDRRDDLTMDAFDWASPMQAPAPAFKRLRAAGKRVREITADIFEWAQPSSPAKKFKLFDVKAGPVTEEEKDLIFELADAGMKSWSIARKIQRHPSSVAWIMWRFGMKTLGIDKKEPYARRGKLIVPFSPEEDQFITERRLDGLTPVQIARLHAERFPDLPHPRSRDTIASRLMMLASDDAARDVL